MGQKNAQVGAAASDLVNDSKKLANELYKEGVNRVNQAEDELKEYSKEYSDKLLKQIHENPFTSVLIAAGVGFLLSTIFKK